MYYHLMMNIITTMHGIKIWNKNMSLLVKVGVHNEIINNQITVTIV